MISNFKSVIRRGEECSVGFGLWIVAAYIIIFIRCVLESLAIDHIVPAISPFNLLHFPIFFITALLWIVIILHVLTGEKIVRISRLGLLFFPIIIMPPLLDMILNVFFVRDLSYTYILENVGERLLNFLNPWYTIPGVSCSLRIEIALISVMAFGYIMLKRQKVLWAVVGGALTFMTCLFFGALPGLIMSGFETFVIPILDALKGKAVEAVFDERILVITELFFGVGAAAIWYYKYDPLKARELWQNLRFKRSLHYLLMAILGMKLFFSASTATDYLLFVKALGALTGLFFAFQFAVVTNDVYDVESDFVSSPTRPLLTGHWQAKEYLTVGWVYLVFAGLFAFWVSDACFMLTMLYAGIACLYSLPPFRLRRFFSASALIIGFEAALAFLIGRLSLNSDGPDTIGDPLVAFLFFLVFTLASGVKDFKDVEGDRRMNIQTLPILLGENKARVVQGVLLMVSYLLVPVFLYAQITHPVVVVVLSMVFAVGSYLYIIRKNSRESLIFALYFVYVVLLLIFLR